MSQAAYRGLRSALFSSAAMVLAAGLFTVAVEGGRRAARTRSDQGR